MLSVNARKYALRIQINCTPAVLIYQEICAIIPRRAQFRRQCETAFVSVAQGIEQWFPKPCAGRSNRPRDTKQKPKSMQSLHSGLRFCFAPVFTSIFEPLDTQLRLVLSDDRASHAYIEFPDRFILHAPLIPDISKRPSGRSDTYCLRSMPDPISRIC